MNGRMKGDVMSTIRFPLFKLLGFRINIDISLFLLAALLIFNLGARYFPGAVPGIDMTLAYTLGAIGALGLFGSIVFHELAHAVVARRFDVGVGGITLFIFGGVAEMTEEAPTPKAEFWIAIAGPIASLLLAAAIFLIGAVFDAAAGPELGALLTYLAVINAILAVFNMIPAFPLDGGRILRSILWWFNGDLLKSTRISSTLGVLLGYGFVALGAFTILQGGLTGGLWYVLIGFFVVMAARQSRLYTEITSSLKGVPISRFLKTEGMTIPIGVTLKEAADAFFARHYLRRFPVLDESGEFRGMLSLKAMLKVKKADWERTTVGSVVEAIDPGAAFTLDIDALHALLAMQDAGVTEMPVVEGGRLLGIVEQRDLINYHAVQMEFAAAGGEDNKAERETTA